MFHPLYCCSGCVKQHTHSLIRQGTWCLLSAPGAATKQMDLTGKPGQWFLKSQHEIFASKHVCNYTTLHIYRVAYPELDPSGSCDGFDLQKPESTINRGIHRLLTFPYWFPSRLSYFHTVLLSSSATMTGLLLPAVKTFPPAWSSCQAFPSWDVAESSRGQLLWHITGNVTR